MTLSFGTSPVLVPNHGLSAPELRSAALDGDVLAIGEGFLPLDAPITATTRALSLAPAVRDARVIVADRSAAWVWGWAPMPTTISTCVAVSARIPSPDRRRLRTREVVISPGETVMLGSVRVTAPIRTVIDLARHDNGDDILALLSAGMLAHRLTMEVLESALAGRRSLSYVRSARERLTAAAALARRAETNDDSAPQPLLTR